jgi:hypothetical protein
MFHLFWIEVILTLLLNSLFIWGLYAASQYSFDINGNITDKEILWKLKYYAEKLPLFIGKPLILCPICMSSVYGTILYLFSYNYSEYMYLPLYIICLAGLQYLIFRIIE